MWLATGVTQTAAVAPPPDGDPGGFVTAETERGSSHAEISGPDLDPPIFLEQVLALLEKLQQFLEASDVEPRCF